MNPRPAIPPPPSRDTVPTPPPEDCAGLPFDGEPASGVRSVLPFAVAEAMRAEWAATASEPADPWALDHALDAEAGQ